MFVINQLVQNRIKNGRLFIYEQDTTNLATVYTYEGSELVAAPNPIYAVDGVFDNSYVLDNNIYDAVAQEYQGDSSDPSGDLRPEMWVQSFSTKLGFKDAPSAADEVVTVKMISGLKNATPVNYAQVLGYWTPTDCEPRLYMWDANCSDTEDGGLVIKSNLSESGRWILLVSGQMKSQYYGVTSLAHQENLRKLLEYPKTIGSFGLVTPSDIIMAPCGDTAWTNPGYGFGTDTYNAYGKNIYCQYNAFFRKQCMIRCCSMHGTGVLGNYKVGYSFAGVQEASLCFQPVRMSNFHEMQHWLQCGSNTLIQDVKPYDWQFDQYNNTLSGDIVVNNAGIVCEQPFKFNKDYNVGASLTFNSCDIVNNPHLDKSVTFKNMGIKEERYDYKPHFVGESAQTANNFQNCSANDNDFTTLNNYFEFGKATNKNVFNCAGKKAITGGYYYFSGSNQGHVIINDLNNTDPAPGRLFLSAGQMDFNNCELANNFVCYSPTVLFDGCILKHGYWYPHYDNYPSTSPKTMHGNIYNCRINNAWNNYVPTACVNIDVSFSNTNMFNDGRGDGLSGALRCASDAGWSGDESRITVNVDDCSLLGYNSATVFNDQYLRNLTLPVRMTAFNMYGGDDLIHKHVWKLEPWSESWGSSQPTWNKASFFHADGSPEYKIYLTRVYNSSGKIVNFLKRNISLEWSTPPNTAGASTAQKVSLVRY